MIYPPEVLDQLEAVEPKPWEGEVWRHMFGTRSPAQINTRGARWNPAEVGAIYTSYDRETALAEGDHVASVQPVRPSVQRRLYKLHVRLTSAIDLSDRDVLAELGVDAVVLGSPDLRPCQIVGGATAWLGRDGLFVPSARAVGTNLVIFVANAFGDDWGPETLSSESVREP